MKPSLSHFGLVTADFVSLQSFYRLPGEAVRRKQLWKKTIRTFRITRSKKDAENPRGFGISNQHVRSSALIRSQIEEIRQL